MTYFLSLFSGLMLISIHVIFVMALTKNFRTLPPVIFHVISCLCLLLVGWLLSIKFALAYWMVFCLLVFGASSYLFIFGAVYKSLSLRFLLAIKSYGGQAKIEDLDVKITKNTFKDRVDILCQMGLVEQTPNGYEITQNGKQTAKKIIALQQFFNINTKGLY